MLDANKLDAFSAAFAVLASLHLQPAKDDTASSMRNMIGQWPLPLEGDTKEGAREISHSTDEDEDARWQDQNEVYGIAAGAKVAPYESVHRGTDGLVFDEQTLQVRKFYAALGYEAPRMGHDPDDHIGLELDFLSKATLAVLDELDANQPERAQAALDLAAAFTFEHVAAWAPQMLASAAEAATTHWLTGVQKLTCGTLAQWQNALQQDGYSPACGCGENCGCASTPAPEPVKIEDNPISWKDQL